MTVIKKEILKVQRAEEDIRIMKENVDIADPLCKQSHGHARPKL